MSREFGGQVSGSRELPGTQYCWVSGSREFPENPIPLR